MKQELLRISITIRELLEAVRECNKSIQELSQHKIEDTQVSKPRHVGCFTAIPFGNRGFTLIERIDSRDQLLKEPIYSNAILLDVYADASIAARHFIWDCNKNKWIEHIFEYPQTYKIDPKQLKNWVFE